MKRKDLERRAKRRNLLEAYTFMLPLIIGLLVFFLFPLGFSIVISFGEFTIQKGGNTFVFLGLKNYRDAFLSDVQYTQVFWDMIVKTLINTPLIVIFSLIMAVILNKKYPGRGFFRTMFFIPFLLGTGYVMRQLLGVGAVDAAMGMARSVVLPQELTLYLGPKVTDVLTMFMDQITWIMWRSGVQMVLFLSGLQSIHTALYESARVDSATEWEIFWKITLPMVSPMTLLVIVYTIIDSFSDPTNPMVDLFLTRAFKESRFSYSAAMSWVYFVFILVVVGAVFFVMKRITYKEFEN